MGHVDHPTSVRRPARRQASLDQQARAPAVRPDDPQLRQPAVDENDLIPGRRPLRHADDHGWVALEGDLTCRAAVRPGHPQVGMTAVIGEVHLSPNHRGWPKASATCPVCLVTRVALRVFPAGESPTGNLQMSDSLLMRHTTSRPDE